MVMVMVMMIMMILCVTKTTIITRTMLMLPVSLIRMVMMIMMIRSLLRKPQWWLWQCYLLVLLSEMHMCGWIFGTDWRKMRQDLSLFLLKIGRLLSFKPNILQYFYASVTYETIFKFVLLQTIFFIFFDMWREVVHQSDLYFPAWFENPWNSKSKFGFKFALSSSF